MFVRARNLVAILLLFVPVGLAGDAPSGPKEAKKDLQRLQGSWQMESYEDGKKTKIDAKKRALFFGANTVAFRDGDRLLQMGMVNLNTAKSPRRVDVLVKKEKNDDSTMLGIYELKGDTLKVCFDPEGDARPTAFEAKAGSSHFVAVYKRVNRTVEEIDIVGKYNVSNDPAAPPLPVSVTAEIERHGDGYQVTWSVPGGAAYNGIAIRTGDVLSVTWGNRGSVGLSVYHISKGPKLSGKYTFLGGPGIMAKEEFTPYKPPKEDVRHGE